MHIHFNVVIAFYISKGVVQVLRITLFIFVAVPINILYMWFSYVTRAHTCTKEVQVYSYLQSLVYLGLVLGSFSPTSLALSSTDLSPFPWYRDNSSYSVYTYVGIK